MSVADFIDGFGSGWELMDGFLGWREGQKEEQEYDTSLSDAQTSGEDKAWANAQSAFSGNSSPQPHKSNVADPSAQAEAPPPAEAVPSAPDPSLPGEKTNYGDPDEAWDATVDPSLPGEQTPYNPAERVNRTTPMDITPEGNRDRAGPRVEYTGSHGSGSLNPQLVGFAEDMTRVTGDPLTVTSGYRDADLNRQVGGVPNSRHLSGNAIDIRTRGQSPEQLRPVLDRAARQGYVEHGVPALRDVGRYKPGKDHAHFQVDEGFRYHPERPPTPPRRPAIPEGYGGAVEQVRNQQQQVSSWDDLDSREVAGYIRRRAPDFGIDGDAAVRVAMTEGLDRGRVHGQSTVPRQGGGSADGREDSWGPFQLYRGGGLGDEFERRTGMDPRDPNSWREQVDFSLREAERRGHWYDPERPNAGPWFGPRDNGLRHTYGFSGSQRAAIPANR